MSGARDLYMRIMREGYKSASHRSAVIEVLYDAQDFKCSICGGDLYLRKASVDHVVPRSRGGRNCLLNFLLAHRLCNFRKGNADPSLGEIELLGRVHERIFTSSKQATIEKARNSR